MNEQRSTTKQQLCTQVAAYKVTINIWTMMTYSSKSFLKRNRLADFRSSLMAFQSFAPQKRILNFP